MTRSYKSWTRLLPHGCAAVVRRWADFLRDLGRFLRPALAVVLLPSATGHAAETFILGDSGADMGNYFELPGRAPAEGAPYYRGTDGLYRLSDGPMWPELLVPGLQSFSDPKRGQGSTNYAYGGAKSDADSFIGDGEDVPVGLLSQLDALESDLKAGRVRVSPGDSAILYAGTNDLFEALALGQDLTGKIAAVRGNLSTAVTRLAAAGLKTVYVSEIADFGNAAAFYNTGLPADEEAALRKSLNLIAGDARTEVRKGLTAVRDSLGGRVNVVLLPANKLFAAVRANPAAFGFTSMTEPIYDDATDTYRVADPAKRDSHFFLDSLHTTARAQRLEADYYRAVIDGAEGRAEARIARSMADAANGFSVVSRALDEPVARQRLVGSATRSWEVFLATPFTQAKTASMPGEARASADTFAGVLGIQWPQSNTPDLKAAVGFFDQDGEVGSRAHRSDARGVEVTVGNERTLGPVRLRAEVGYGRVDLKLHRDSGVPTLISRGKTTGDVSHASLVADHTFALGHSISLTTEFGLDYRKTSFDVYRETGADGLDLEVDRSRQQSLRALGSAQLQFAEQHLGPVRFTPQLRVNVSHELSENGFDVRATLIDNTAYPITGSASEGRRWHTAVEPRVLFPLWDNGALVLGYRYEADGHDLERHGLWLNVSQRF